MAINFEERVALSIGKILYFAPILPVLCDRENGTYNFYHKKLLVDCPSQKPSKTIESHIFTIFTGKYGDHHHLVFPDEAPHMREMDSCDICNITTYRPIAVHQ